MDQENYLNTQQFFDTFFNGHLHSAVLSSPVSKEGVFKIKIRPLMLQQQLVFQAEEFNEKQVFHKNIPPNEISDYVLLQLNTQFKQLAVVSAVGEGHILVSKKGRRTIKMKRYKQSADQPTPNKLTHNRKKRYLIEEGEPIPFLIDLGVMTPAGKIIHAKYDKFKQINRFLEFIEDIVPQLDPQKENVIIDFGCGKSYLTFAIYYYLKILRNYPVRMIGLDLKPDVIDHCNRLKDRYGYQELEFLIGDIANYAGVDHVDMVVTLHACDMATDFALAKAVEWNAKVILSVPCCQHELNRQIKNELMQPIFQYGIIKERMAALYTDALRAQLLEGQGYRTQLLEFIDLEHTPKNILIRAVRQGAKKQNQQQIRDITDFLQVNPALVRLLNPDAAGRIII